MAFTPQSNLADANIDQIPPSADAVSGTPFLVKVPGFVLHSGLWWPCGGRVRQGRHEALRVKLPKPHFPTLLLPHCLPEPTAYLRCYSTLDIGVAFFRN